MRNGIRAGLAMAAVAAFASAAAGCASTTQSQSSGQVSVMMRGVAAIEPAADPRPLAAADTAFGLDVLRQWCAQYPGKNLVFSPSTLASSLGMAYLGARGATAQDMARVLHLPAVGAGDLAAQLQARSDALGRLDGPGVTLAASNQVWADPRLPPLHGYLNAVATGYGAGVAQAPFSTDPQRAADDINNAISAATRGHITNLVSASMAASVDWVLTSALYMNAAWATPFDPNQTAPGSFTLASAREVTAQYMSGDSFFPYTAAGGWQAVSLPYKGGKLTMTALLPPSGSGACALPSQATLGTITAGLSAAGSTDTARVSLPKVNLSTGGAQGDMEPVLKRLGMRLAFSPAADFTALSPAACCIGFVQQAATLQVGEKGTVASAAAATGVEPAAAFGGKQVAFDRPYLMLVTDTATGEPLFLAEVANPTVS